MYKIIIADDEHIVLTGIIRTIPWQEYGVSVVAAAEDGKKLVEFALRYQPDIILTDIRMPGFDGLSALAELKELLPDCEFLIMTAYEEFEYAKKAIELGVSGYIVKPVLKAELLEHVMGITKKLDARRGYRTDLSSEDAISQQESRSPIERALRYMRSHVEKDLSLLEIAEYLHMNPSYFSRYFKEKTGKTFSETLQEIKVERAKTLIETTNLKTYEIAERLGYRSAQHFSVLFKNYAGLTPQEYRNQSV